MITTTRLGIVLLRVVVALLLLVHGVMRVRLGVVDDFGGFLSLNQIPLGNILAWTITVVEIAGGLILILGYWVVWLCGWFIIQLIVGVFLVHAKDGWFVVGAGRNGMEYSVMLIAALISIALTHWQQTFPQRSKLRF
jgi:putative oxidoreductase